MPSHLKVEGLYVLIAGGSRGLGLAMGIELAQKGAHIILAARGRETLEEAKKVVLSHRKADTKVDIISIDLCDAKAVSSALESLGIVPDILICVAGGTNPSQIGFLADLEPESLKTCLDLNYFTSVYIAQRVLQLWIHSPKPTCTRHVIFVSSAAALVAIPGYIAYSPPKAAIRTFADSLRQELLMYGDTSQYQVHAAFPGTFITDSFLAEQATKPELTKTMEGSNISDAKIVKKTPSAESIAKGIISGVDKGNFFITTDFDSSLILNNMRGQSPRDNVLLDLALAFLALLVWPFVRRSFDKKTTDYGKTRSRESGVSRV